KDRRMGSRAMELRGSAQAGTPVEGRLSSLDLFRFVVFLGALRGLSLAFPVWLLTRPEDVRNGLRAESGSLDCCTDVDIELDLLLVAHECRASQMAARPEAERRREKPLDLPECERDEELLLLLRETERLLTLLAPKRTDETNIKNEGRADGLGDGVVDREDRLHALVRLGAELLVELHAR